MALIYERNWQANVEMFLKKYEMPVLNQNFRREISFLKTFYMHG